MIRLVTGIEILLVIVCIITIIVLYIPELIPSFIKSSQVMQPKPVAQVPKPVVPKQVAQVVQGKPSNIFNKGYLPPVNKCDNFSSQSDCETASCYWAVADSGGAKKCASSSETEEHWCSTSSQPAIWCSGENEPFQSVEDSGACKGSQCIYSCNTVDYTCSLSSDSSGSMSLADCEDMCGLYGCNTFGVCSITTEGTMTLADCNKSCTPTPQ